MGIAVRRSFPARMLDETPPPPYPARRMLFAILFALSFAPYALPAEHQPSVYRDGRAPEAIARDQHVRQLNRFLGGDLRDVEFGGEVLERLPPRNPSPSTPRDAPS